jgi:hypothetical protein
MLLYYWDLVLYGESVAIGLVYERLSCWEKCRRRRKSECECEQRCIMKSCGTDISRTCIN